MVLSKSGTGVLACGALLGQAIGVLPASARTTPPVDDVVLSGAIASGPDEATAHDPAARQSEDVAKAPRRKAGQGETARLVQPDEITLPLGAGRAPAQDTALPSISYDSPVAGQSATNINLTATLSGIGTATTPRP